MNDREKAKERMAVLKRLREEHAATVESTQALLKEQKALRKLLKSAMEEGPMTIPQIAAASDLPSDQVLWHLMALKKYDLVRETGRDGDYYLYQLVNGASK